jgi:hypothetical protein
VLLKGWKEDATYTADLTVTPQPGPKGNQWFAVVSGITLKVKAEVRDVSKFPDDYVGKSVQMVVWVDPDAMSKSKEADGQFQVALRGSSERLVPFPAYGSPNGFIRDEVNYLIPADMAKSFSKEIKPGGTGRYTVTLTLKKEKMPGGESYVGRITKAE